MSGLVSFDHKGAFGPAMTLVYHCHNYNKKGMAEVTALLKGNFEKLAKMQPEGDWEFCVFILSKSDGNSTATTAEIVGTRFFQSMQKPGPLHAQVLQFVVPQMLKTAQEEILRASREEPQVLKEWIAGFLECYMTEEQIKKYCDSNASASAKIDEERKNIGMQMYQLVSTKQFNQNDLDSLIKICREVLSTPQAADHYPVTLQMIGKYLALFGMKLDTPQLLGDEVLNSLDTTFRTKFFK